MYVYVYIYIYIINNPWVSIDEECAAPARNSGMCSAWDLTSITIITTNYHYKLMTSITIITIITTITIIVMIITNSITIHRLKRIK